MKLTNQLLTIEDPATDDTNDDADDADDIEDPVVVDDNTPTDTPELLPHTGPEHEWMAGLAGLLALSGVALLGVSRRLA